MSDGTGIVHIAPAFGEDDAKVGRKYDLPFVQFVDGKGELTKETPYAGLFVKKADPEVLKDLDKEGKLFDAPKFEHDYPYCWRCDTPLGFRKLLELDVLVHGLKMFRTGEFHVTDTGVLLLISGYVMIVEKCYLSEARQN